ncbi:hybrid sensor histidine kinase/response regulator, partial [Pseudomonas syringae pv. tagetis]
ERLMVDWLIYVQRADSVPLRVLAFSRVQCLDEKAVSVYLLINALAVVLQKIVSEKVFINFDFSAEDALIFADANQLEIALLNLVIYARDA